MKFIDAVLLCLAALARAGAQDSGGSTEWPRQAWAMGEWPLNVRKLITGFETEELRDQDTADSAVLKTKVSLGEYSNNIAVNFARNFIFLTPELADELRSRKLAAVKEALKGDLFYIQNLLAASEAANSSAKAPPTNLRIQ